MPGIRHGDDDVYDYIDERIKLVTVFGDLLSPKCDTKVKLATSVLPRLLQEHRLDYFPTGEVDTKCPKLTPKPYANKAEKTGSNPRLDVV